VKSVLRVIRSAEQKTSLVGVLGFCEPTLSQKKFPRGHPETFCTYKTDTESNNVKKMDLFISFLKNCTKLIMSNDLLNISHSIPVYLENDF